jgi:hypothetical protein
MNATGTSPDISSLRLPKKIATNQFLSMTPITNQYSSINVETHARHASARGDYLLAFAGLFSSILSQMYYWSTVIDSQERKKSMLEGTYGTTAASIIPSCDIRSASSSAGGTCKYPHMEGHAACQQTMNMDAWGMEACSIFWPFSWGQIKP